ncbi:MAG: SdrD B-like domain-containing protein, partial [Bacteroidota bacterium]
MNTFLRTSLFVLVGLCLLSASSTLGQKKQDKVLTKAQKLLQGYKPPQASIPPPTETPAQAWKSAYAKQHQSKAKSLAGSGARPAEPTVNQYHKKGLGELIRKQLAEASKPLSRTDMKQRADNAVQDAERSGKGEALRLKQKGIHFAPRTTPQEMQKHAAGLKPKNDESKKRDEEIARQEQLRHHVPTVEDFKKEGANLVAQDQLNKRGPFGPRNTAGIAGTGILQGVVWSDANHNGAQDSLEQGLAGWHVYAYLYYHGITLPAVADSAGNYQFSGLPSDYYDYYHIYADSVGWYSTYAPPDYWYYTSGNDTLSGLNFGKWQIIPRSISGTVFSDSNHNAVKDTLEQGIGGWTVNLYEYSTNTSYTTTTDSLGHYRFDSLKQVSEYRVYQTVSDGWAATVGDYYPTLAYNSIDTLNFGNWKIIPRSISGVVFNDANHNGVRDTLESGLAGWTIRLLDYATYTWYTTTTDTTGAYHFDSLMHVGTYYLDENGGQFGWLETSPTSNDYYFSLNYDSSTGNDFGDWHMPPVAMSGTVFNDLNNNGMRDPGEPGLAGWQLNILRNSPGQWFSATTDTLGNYTFTDSGYASWYTVYEANTSGWLETSPWRSQSAYHQAYLVGDTAIAWDFGNWFVSPGAIRGTVFNDLNDNGTNDSEPGLAGWTIHAYNQDTEDTLTTVTDSLGNYAFYNLSWVHYYQVFEDQQLDWIRTYPGGSYWQPYVAGDTVESVNFGNYLPAPGALRVDAMPSSSVSSTYANALAGVPLTVWGNVHGGLVPLHYTLDYGDGNVDTGIVTNRRFIGSMHTYSTAGPKTMILTVVDANDSVGTNQSVIKVYAAPSQQIRTNMAIEKGLLYLYLNQYPDGWWNDNSNTIASTGGALLSFEENGHKPSNNIATDIYAEYVRLGLNYLFSAATKHSISVQPAGNPDANGNGYGAYFYDQSYPNGLGMLAVIGAYSNPDSAKMDTIQVGAYSGTNFYDFIVDGMDEWAYSQTDSGWSGRGGWRYSVSTSNSGDADNSTTQWATLDLEAAQNSWGIAIPQFVKTELLYWLQYSQDGSGGFGYTAPSDWNNTTKTAAGIGSYAFLGYTTDSTPVAMAINFINADWGNSYDGSGWADPLTGNTYAMYGVAKGMRLINHRAGNQFIGTHDWYAEYVSHLLDNPSYRQNPDGSWPRSSSSPTSYMGDALNSSLAILVLTRGVVVQPPVAVIEPIGALPPKTSFQVDGSNSFHQDPSKSIVEWLWDWNAGDGLNWNHPDASGPKPTNPGYADTGNYTITLRVKDNSNPPLYAVATANVHITLNHHPPVAVAIPPKRGSGYAGKVGEPIFLDGSASYSPDYPKDSVVVWRWDLNGNGNYYDSSDVVSDTVTVVFNTPYQGQVGLRVYDTHGDSSSNVAYLNIVASKTDLFVAQFKATPDSLYQGQTVHLFAVVKNNDSSNTGATHVLVRFYDDDPLTVGNQLGGDFFVDLPVSAVDTVQTDVRLSPRFKAGTRHFYVFLDANNQVAEWNEVNNLAHQDVEVLPIHPTSVFDRMCLNFATLPVGDTLVLPLLVSNTGNDTLFVDSLIASNASFTAVDGPGDSVVPGNAMTFHIRFIPNRQGTFQDTLTIYSNDVVHMIYLSGQGELTSGGPGAQIYRGLLTVDGAIAPMYTVVGAYRASGDLIMASMVQVIPETAAVRGSNYSLTVTVGQAGIAAGDTIVFKIQTLQCESLPVRYCEPFFAFAPQIDSGGYLQLNLDGVHPHIITDRLRSGYNAVSWNVQPPDPKLTTVFGGILSTGKVRIILDYVNNGNTTPGFDFYLPPLGQYNSLQMTQFKKGYFVMLNNDVSVDSMTVTGLPLCPSIPIGLDSNYNFVSYLPEQSDSVRHALSSLMAGNLNIALRWTNDGLSALGFHSYPDGDFSVMMPGEGYFVKVDSPDVLVYPGPPTSKALPSRMKTASVKPRHTSGTVSSVPSAVFAYGLHVQ